MLDFTTLLQSEFLVIIKLTMFSPSNPRFPRMIVEIPSYYNLYDKLYLIKNSSINSLLLFIILFMIQDLTFLHTKNFCNYHFDAGKKRQKRALIG